MPRRWHDWAAPASGSPGRLLAILTGHTGGVRDVALSTDGQLVASGSLDRTVRLWEAAPASGPSGRLLATLQGHSGVVRCVALSTDGRLVASVSEDGTVRLWEAAPASRSPGRPLATVQGHTGPILGVALSGDGRLLASGSFDGTVRLWEAPSGQLLATLHAGVWWRNTTAIGGAQSFRPEPGGGGAHPHALTGHREESAPVVSAYAAPVAAVNTLPHDTFVSCHRGSAASGGRWAGGE